MRTSETYIQTFLYKDDEVTGTSLRYEQFQSEIDYEQLKADVLDYLDDLHAIVVKKEETGEGPSWAHERHDQLWDFAIDQGFIPPLPEGEYMA